MLSDVSEWYPQFLEERESVRDDTIAGHPKNT